MLVDTQKLVAPEILKCFYHFRTCKRMRKHALAGPNTQPKIIGHML